METLVTLKQLLAENNFYIPTYQDGYSWDTELDESNSSKQTNIFLSELELYIHSTQKSKYYFGHFILQEKSENKFEIIDGQQRLTTIIILLSVLFLRLRQIRILKETEIDTYKDMIKRNESYRFETVDYDNQFFRDFVIDRVKKDKKGIETESAKRIVKAFNYFSSQLQNKDENYLVKILNTFQNAYCTIYTTKDKYEAAQIFNFTNKKLFKRLD